MIDYFLMDKFKAINVNNILTDKLKLNYISTTIFFPKKNTIFYLIDNNKIPYVIKHSILKHNFNQ